MSLSDQPVETDDFTELDESKKLPPQIIFQPTTHPIMEKEEKEPE